MNDIENKVYDARHTGDLELAGHQISCAVIDVQGKPIRLLVERSMAEALGYKGPGSYWKRKREGKKGASLPEYVSLEKLSQFMTDDLRRKLETPYVYKDAKTGKTRDGIDATVLPDICDIWITARESGALDLRQQQDTAKKAYLLMKGFAHVGITALVDEATGYQDVRDRIALQEILEKYISGHLLVWAKRFPNEFYMEMFRLKSWPWKGMSVNRPRYVGKLTNDIVYDRLAPGVLVELQKRTPRDEKGNTKNRFHQWLTAEVGHPALASHLHAVIALMKASATWNGFTRSLQRAFPKFGETPELPLEEMN